MNGESMAAQVVLGAYMLLLLGLGYAGYRRGRNTEEDYYLAGRGQGLLVTSLTIMATMFSSAAMLGIPGVIYRDGASFLSFALNLPLSGAAVYVLGNRIRRLGRARRYVTPADMVADYYGQSSVLRLLVALIGVLYVIPYIIMQIKAGGLLARTMFPDAENAFGWGTAALSLVTLAYILVGGMRSVAWTDVIQGTLLLGGMLVAGVATIHAMGGVGPFFARVGDLPAEALSVPGPSDAHHPSRMFTVCLFASLGTMVHPGQWMRYYAADSGKTLRRTALIFAIVLPACFFFGVFLVALGGRVLYPPAFEMIDGVRTFVPHAAVGDQDQIVIVMMREQVPQFVGSFAVVLVPLLLVAVMAASMSTADSNLHALSAVLTRDVYDRMRPGASERERLWAGRIVIVVAMAVALLFVRAGEQNADFALVKYIAQLMFVAIAFSSQALPVAVDMLFLNKGTRAGAIAGMVAGLVTVLHFTPFIEVALGGSSYAGHSASLTSSLKKIADIGAVGCGVNIAVFALVSRFTRPLSSGHVARFRADCRGFVDAETLTEEDQ